MFGVFASYVNPIVNFVDAWRSSHAQQSELQALKREHTRLGAKVASLNDSSAAAVAARKLGMIAPGERSFSLRNLPH